jgi:multidrug efflux pump
MLARFFIDRPIFAMVISILITLAGGISVFTLPVAQYPQITPPTVQVDCNYPGASAQVVAESVAAPIEQYVNGVEDMLYMSSQCTSDGSYTLTITFKLGKNLNLAQILVQNRVNLALPSLPDVVKQTGVTTRKRSPDILLTVSINSPSGKFDQLYLSNYSVLRLKDELSRIPGISDVTVFGQRDYSLRVWVDPEKLAARSINASDVVNALRAQNMPVAMGQIGQPPNAETQPIQVTLNSLGRLESIEDFENVALKSDHDGSVVYIKDVARVELGAKREDVNNRFNSNPTIGLAVFMLPDSNALETADMVRAKMDELQPEFPEGMRYQIGYDTTPFIRESINEVFKSLRDSVILVAFVVLAFLQNWRSALIPLIAVPVAIVGTFAVMAAVGFTLNNLTLFGLVLAVGIVVDDAIVVVEAVEHQIELGLNPRDATIQAMKEVSGPVIAVGLVLTAVFVPCAFISGIIGQFFRQFALTIAISTLISTFNSLTLSPALAAILLRPKGAKRDPLQWLIDFCFGWFFRLFNWAFRVSTAGYIGLVGWFLRLSVIVLVVYCGLLGLTYWSYLQLPTGFIPSQDKGYLIASVQLPDAAASSRTDAVIAKMEKLALSTPGIRYTNSVSGNSFVLSAYGSNFGSMFIILDPFHDRIGPGLSGDEIAATLRRKFTTEIPEAMCMVFGPPAVSGLGRAGGFKLMVKDRGDVGPRMLQGQTENLVEKGNQQPGLTGLSTAFRANAPQLFIDVNREECLKHGLSLGEVFATLQVYLGSRYVNDFNRFGRTWQVVVQADARFRNQIEDVKRLKVRNHEGQMVPLGAIATIREENGVQSLTRYNMYPAASITGNLKPGVSTGEGMAIVEKLAGRELLPGVMSFDWTEINYLQQISGSTGLWMLALSVVFVFLVLAALYESWTLPMAVLLVVPMCVLSSLAGVAYAKMDINIFTQVGFIVLVGLASKNAILIVEFAKGKRESGVPRFDATIQACRLRLRPILMTSFAFILGVVPLVIAEGAGKEMRRALGTAVFSGMLGVTLFGIFLTPVFFMVIDRMGIAVDFALAGPLNRLKTWMFGNPPAEWVKGRVGALTTMVSRTYLKKLPPPPNDHPVVDQKKPKG